MKHPQSLNILSIMNYKIFLSLLIIIFLCHGFNAFCQGKVTRPAQQQSQTSKPQKSRPKVTISEPDGYINGHGYVDLGLPSGTLWATCNIGASSPTDLGEQYAWGEIRPKSGYTEDNSLWQGKECADIGGHPEFDAASANWGEHWRLPSHEQIKELDEKCKWVYTKRNGVRGFIIIGPNGKNIFLASRMSTSKWTYGTYVCGYWSSTPNERDYTSTDMMSSARGRNSNNKRLAYCITSSDNSAWIASGSKYNGLGIRPVYCDSVYKPKADFIGPEGRTYVGKADVFTISGCWMIPSYSNISSKDSGDVSIFVKFDKDGNVTNVTINGQGPVSKNDETLNAIETEIRSKKMKPMFSSKENIPDETEARIRYEFR